MGYIQKIDVDVVVRQELGVKTLHKFLDQTSLRLHVCMALHLVSILPWRVTNYKRLQVNYAIREETH